MDLGDSVTSCSVADLKGLIKGGLPLQEVWDAHADLCYVIEKMNQM
jgi:hypothetical protein